MRPLAGRAKYKHGISASEALQRLITFVVKLELTG
jgi:hypothetical protein